MHNRRSQSLPSNTPVERNFASRFFRRNRDLKYSGTAGSEIGLYRSGPALGRRVRSPSGPELQGHSMRKRGRLGDATLLPCALWAKIAPLPYESASPCNESASPCNGSETRPSIIDDRSSSPSLSYSTSSRTARRPFLP